MSHNLLLSCGNLRKAHTFEMIREAILFPFGIGCAEYAGCRPPRIVRNYGKAIGGEYLQPEPVARGLKYRVELQGKTQTPSREGASSRRITVKGNDLGGVAKKVEIGGKVARGAVFAGD